MTSSDLPPRAHESITHVERVVRWLVEQKPLRRDRTLPTKHGRFVLDTYSDDVEEEVKDFDARIVDSRNSRTIVIFVRPEKVDGAIIEGDFPYRRVSDADLPGIIEEFDSEIGPELAGPEFPANTAA